MLPGDGFIVMDGGREGPLSKFLDGDVPFEFQYSDVMIQLFVRKII